MALVSPRALSKVALIRKLVCQMTGITNQALSAKGRSQHLANARFIAMGLSYELTDLSAASVGVLFGNRDHSTVLKGYERMQDMVKLEPAFRADVESIRALLQKEQAPKSRPPLERMWEAHKLLSAGKPVTCKIVASTLEVSPATIKRDLEFMRDRLHVPLEYDAKRGTWRYSGHAPAMAFLERLCEQPGVEAMRQLRCE